MPNSGQTRIFYKVGQTRLTREKCDPVDPDDPDDPSYPVATLVSIAKLYGKAVFVNFCVVKLMHV